MHTRTGNVPPALSLHSPELNQPRHRPGLPLIPPKSPRRLAQHQHSNASLPLDAAAQSSTRVVRPTIDSRPVLSRTVPVPSSPTQSLSSQDYGTLYPAHDARPNNHPHAKHVRESTWTQTSNGNTFSTLYPPSTSSDTPLTPITPTGMEYHEVSDSSDEEPEAEVYSPDPGDIQYRLNLLVNNSYFLPPAHSKPSHFDRRERKPPTPPKSSSQSNLRNVFRLGSKGRDRSPAPPSPSVGPPRDSLPVLNRQRSYSHSRIPLGVEKERTGRVAVIRERLDDFEPNPHPSDTPPVPPQGYEIVDPTDAVDLPSYAFQVQPTIQASIGHERGTSNDAAALADFLPSSSRLQHDNETWRRDLLTQAIGHSFATSIPSSSRANKPIKIPRSAHQFRQPVPEAPSVAFLGQPILRSRASASSLPQVLRPPPVKAPPPTPRLPVFATPPVSPALSGPVHPVQSLPPPPRGQKPRSPPAAFEKTFATRHTIRRSLSTPLLSETYAAQDMSPPLPLPISLIPPHSASPQLVLPNSESGRSFSTASHYSDEDEDADFKLNPPRLSSVSLGESGVYSARPSISAMSHRSHVPSVFGPPRGQESPAPSSPAFLHPDQYTSSGYHDRPVSSLSLRRETDSRQSLRREEDRESNAGTEEQEISTLRVNSRPRALSNASSRSRVPTTALEGSTLRHERFDGTAASTASLPMPSSSGSSTYSFRSATSHPPENFFETLDPSKPVTNTPTTKTSFLSRAFGTKKSSSSLSSSSSPRIPESTFELLKNTRGGDGATLESIIASSTMASAPSFANLRAMKSASSLHSAESGKSEGISSWRKAQPLPSGQAFDGMLTMHVQREQEVMKRITEENVNLRSRA